MSEEKTLDEFRQEGLASFITDIHKQVTGIAAVDVRTMPEYVFKEAFLPMFAGDDPLPYPVTFEYWVNLAGGIAKEVKIVDPKGEVLFTVPALGDLAAVRPITDGSGRFAHVVASAEQYARIHPKQGQQYLDAQLRDRTKFLRVPPNVLEHLETWNQIFERYGRPPIMKVDQADGSGDGVSGDGDNTSYEFDPL